MKSGGEAFKLQYWEPKLVNSTSLAVVNGCGSNTKATFLEFKIIKFSVWSTKDSDFLDWFDASGTSLS